MTLTLGVGADSKQEKTTKLKCYKELPVNYKTINSLYKDNPKAPEGFTFIAIVATRYKYKGSV